MQRECILSISWFIIYRLADHSRHCSTATSMLFTVWKQSCKLHAQEKLTSGAAMSTVMLQRHRPWPGSEIATQLQSFSDVDCTVQVTKYSVQCTVCLTMNTSLSHMVLMYINECPIQTSEWTCNSTEIIISGGPLRMWTFNTRVQIPDRVHTTVTVKYCISRHCNSQFLA